MTGAISSLAIGSDQVKSSDRAQPFDALYFVGLLLFVDHARRSTCCPSGSCAACGGTTDGRDRPDRAGPRARCELALRGSKRDVRGARLPRRRCCSSLLLSLLILIVLLGHGARRRVAGAVRRRLGDFVTSDVSRLATTSGGAPGHRRLADPDRVRRGGGDAAGRRGGDLPAGVRARHARSNRLLTTNIRNLAGVPSIVYGILGLVVFVQAMRSIHRPRQRSAAATSPAGLTLSVLVLPIIILITMEALRAVPKSIREAAYGVGATRWEVVRSHVLPYAAPGVFTGLDPVAGPGVRRDGAAAAGGRRHRLPVHARRSATPLEILQGQVHGAADPDLLMVPPGRRGLEGEHGRGDRRAARDHPRREPRRDPAEEPI